MLVVSSSGSPEAMPAAQALNRAVLTRADEQKTSVSKG